MQNTIELDEEIKGLVAQGEAGELDKNKLHITQAHVCKSAAGCYIGQWCVEFESDMNMWFPQPYQRLSGYGTREQMLSQLPHYRQQH